jgi:hypothetical protein
MGPPLLNSMELQIYYPPMHNGITMKEKGLLLPSFEKVPGAVAIDLDGDA